MIENKKILIIAHVFTTVPAQDLKEYFLQRKVKSLMFIAHPLFFVEGRSGPYYEIYEHGKLIKKYSRITTVLQLVMSAFHFGWWNPIVTVH